MASFCHFWRMTPPQYWDLDLDDYYALTRYQEKFTEQHEAETARLRSGRRRR